MKWNFECCEQRGHSLHRRAHQRRKDFSASSRSTITSRLHHLHNLHADQAPHASPCLQEPVPKNVLPASARNSVDHFIDCMWRVPKLDCIAASFAHAS